jgi:hypothetical protein
MNEIIKVFSDLSFGEKFSLIFLLGVGTGFIVSMLVVLYQVIVSKVVTSKSVVK